MVTSHVVVDGSNIATEGRSVPSLRQLDEAVRQFQDEFPDKQTIVVVDATFGHRIDPGEHGAFDDAVAHGELVSPPAGAIGRGDAFVLRIAERVGGQVLSNDSFQEFHAEHPWLFDEGRLIGGKPVPGVGWIFTLRTPVRGPRSRAAARQQAESAPGRRRGEAVPSAPPARRRTRVPRSAAVLAAVEAAAAEATEAALLAPPPPGEGQVLPVPPPVPPPAPPSGVRRRRRRRPGGGDPEVEAAIEAATEESQVPEVAVRRGPEAVNDPLTFLTFITEHPLGATIVGAVSTFVSHGAMVDVGDMHCYVPLSGLAVPPPKSARAVLRKGDTREFVVVALDSPRRGAQLALPDVAALRGAPARPPGTSGEPEATSRPAPAAKATSSPTATKAKGAAPAKKANKAAPAKKAPAAEATGPVAGASRTSPTRSAQPADKRKVSRRKTRAEG